ncbi:PucR family transcriptional regulator [Paenibacillus sp. 1P03SA]|uniref:PucR family transcriptional regulator n=1 Tax=Paenibacillus sp. 1P03SA TaxID=3132294 RepID=UPI0039A206D4
MTTSFTVKNLLDMPLFQGAEVLAGAQGLSNEIFYVDCMETPDLTGWLRPNELILTTGYSFRFEPSMLCRLLDEMHRVGGSAVGIKTKRYLQEVHPEAIELSNRYGIPLFDIPLDVPFMDMTRSIMDQILQRQAYLLKEVQEVNQQFTGMVLNRKFSELVILIGKLLRCEVAILNRDGEVESGTAEYTAEAGVENRPVFTGNRVFGTLSLTRKLEDGDHFAKMCLDHAVMALAIEFTIRQAQQLHRAREQELFAAELLSGGVSRQEDLLRHRARHLGIPFGDWVYVMALRASCSADADTGTVKTLHSRLAEEMNRDSGGQRRLAVEINDRLLLVCAADRQDTGKQIDTARKYKAELEGRASRITGASVTVRCGIGAVRGQYADLHASCLEARQALAFGEQEAAQPEVLHFRDRLVEHLLMDVAGHPLLEQLHGELLQPLLDYDAEAGTELLPTLKAYLKSGSTKQVAEELFIHRNSVLYRLERIRELLQADIHDPDIRFRLDLAIRYGQSRKIKRLCPQL